MVKEPEDWEHKTVGDCSLILQGGTPSTLIGEYWDGDVSWVTPSDISRLTGMWITNSERNLSPAGIANSSAVILPKKTILLCTRATIGALALTTRPMATNQGFKNLVCKPGVDPVFLAYLLTTKTDEMKALSVGTTFLELSKKNLSEIPLRVPPYSEQRAIAEVLSGFDEHLANLDELITKKKAIRDGALEGLMSRDLRLDGYNMPWAVRSLDEIAHSRRESSTGDPMDMDVELENLLPGEGQVVGDTSVRTAASFIFRPGDVLFGRLRPYLKKYWLATCSGLRSGEIWALAAKDGIDPRFLFHLVRSQRFLDAAGKTMGTKMPRADWSLLKTESFEVPEVDEQRAIAEVLSGMDDEIHLLAEERAKAERLKLGAMDDLLTGRVRLTLGKEAA